MDLNCGREISAPMQTYSSVAEFTTGDRRDRKIENTHSTRSDENKTRLSQLRSTHTYTHTHTRTKDRRTFKGGSDVSLRVKTEEFLWCLKS